MKDSTVSARVEYNVKNEAEAILQKLGIPVSVLINSLYRQIIIRQGIPFAMTLPSALETLDALSKPMLDSKLKHSYEQTLTGQINDFNSVFDKLEQGLV